MKYIFDYKHRLPLWNLQKNNKKKKKKKKKKRKYTIGIKLSISYFY